ncbi:M20/M25/M40 family metallo-hydrolase [Klebsiella sp. RHBSTW-00215]|uniref:M20/M25/M40 family metallo-hydrolase n=1 Tax=Klebsiella sp. RHBSTW-00215 TaxID=2742640 RepID=UPI0023DDE0EA|nr:M20/M25/M40 family metallo-hydrolase [Klebsiella sp. RHBSTW-00215]
MQDIIRYIHREGVKIAKRCSVEIDTDEISFKQPVEMDSTLKDIIKNICKERNLTWQHMSSGAGHDAMIMAGISRSAMIFVPCEKGITHHPAERVFWDDMENGVNVLFNTILKIDSL